MLLWKCTRRHGLRKGALGRGAVPGGAGGLATLRGTNVGGPGSVTANAAILISSNLLLNMQMDKAFARSIGPKVLKGVA